MLYAVLVPAMMAVATALYRSMGELRYLIVPPAVIVAFAVLMRVVLPVYGARRAWRTGVVLRQPLAGIANETSVRLRRGGMTSETPWESFYRYTQSRSTILLYRSSQEYVAVHRELFAGEDEWEHFLRLVRARLTDRIHPRSLKETS